MPDISEFGQGQGLPLTGGTLTGDLILSGADIVMGANDITVTTGKFRHAEISFRESKCPRCGDGFNVGERTGLMITYIYTGEETKKMHTLARLVHIRCDLVNIKGKNRKELRGMLKDELLDYTAIENIEANYMMTKEEIITVIKEAS